MRILVLGSKGMLGTEFMNILSSYHNMISGHYIDINSPDSCRIIDKISPDIVINCAAYTNVDTCESNHMTCLIVNGHSLKTVAKACKNIKLIHFSTDYVFDGTKLTPYDEEDECSPINKYGESKRIGEFNLFEHSPNYLLIRTSWLYGKHNKNFISAILEKSKIGEPLKVVDDQLGSPTYTKDLVLAVNNLLNCNGIFHITNQGSCTWFDYAKEILRIAKINTEIIPINSFELDRAAKRPMNSVLNNSKYNQATNKPLRHWNLALKEYLEEIL